MCLFCTKCNTDTPPARPFGDLGGTLGLFGSFNDGHLNIFGVQKTHEHFLYTLVSVLDGFCGILLFRNTSLRDSDLKLILCILDTMSRATGRCNLGENPVFIQG